MHSETTDTKTIKAVLDYHTVPLADLQVRARSAGVERKADRLNCEVKLGDYWVKTSPRFWDSFFGRYGLSNNIFKFYRHQEVLERVAQKKAGSSLRVTIDKTNPASHTALAVSGGKECIKPEVIMNTLNEFNVTRAEYNNGVIVTHHLPKIAGGTVEVGNDVFQCGYAVETPVDGYGDPSIYLEMLRQVCLNGAIALAPAFKQAIKMGDMPYESIERALESFSSDEGYTTLKQRMRSAQNSPASLLEARGLHKRILQGGAGDINNVVKNKLTDAWRAAVGDVWGQYGVASLDGLSDRRLRLLPSQATVYDLINLATEAATHHLDGAAAMKMHAWVGSLLSREYDLEGTKAIGDDYEFRDLWLDRPHNKMN